MIILLGDTNCDLSVNPNTTDGSVPLFSGNARHIKDMYEIFGLTQLISEPTRETEHTSTRIDDIAVSNVRNISKSGVVRTAISDHYLVYTVRKNLGGIERKHKQIYTRQMKNFNEEAFLRDLSAYDWSSILYCSEDLNVVIEKWINMHSVFIETHAPLMQKRVSERYSHWLSSSLKDLPRSRDKLKIAAVKSKAEILMAAYRQVRNKANRMNADLKRHISQKK